MKYYGDFLGFQFGSYHSRDLGLYRVSDGDRYNDVSIPNFTDTTQKIPGGDGTYYWDSFYTQRTFTINTAFDSLSESQLRNIRQIFNGKAEDWLILDEVPYKKYRVKVQNPPQIKYHSFREDYKDGEYLRPRVYKGEIIFQFISYTPYAIDNFKTAPFRGVKSGPRTTTVRTGVLKYKLTLRSSNRGVLRTIDANTPIKVPVEYFQDTNSLSFYDCICFVQETGSNDYILYRIGSNESAAVVVEKSGSTYRMKYRNGPDFFVESFGEEEQDFEYYLYSGVWNKKQVDPSVYNKNPSHYYYRLDGGKNYGSLYIPNAGQHIEENKTYNYVPEFLNQSSVQEIYPNIGEWYDSVQLLSTSKEIDLRHNKDLTNGQGTYGYFIYNPGDVPTDVKIILDSVAIPSDLSIVLYHRNQGTELRTGDTIVDQLNFSNFTVQPNDKLIYIDTAKNLVYGTDYNGVATGNLYNKYINSGNFFKLPVTQKPDKAKSNKLIDYCDYLWINIPFAAYVFLDYNYLYY